MEALERLAEKLGVTVQYLWAALLRQAPIEGCVDILWWLVALGCLVGGIKWWKWAHKQVVSEESDDFLLVPPTILLFLVGLWLIALTTRLSGTIAALVNPEYWALSEVMSLLPR